MQPTDQAIARPIERAAGSQYRRMIMKRFMVAAGIIAGIAFGAAVAQTKPTIPVIVKDLTSPYWRTVLAGARKAGQDLGVNVVGFGDSDASKQIALLATVVASNPASIVIAAPDFEALG